MNTNLKMYLQKLFSPQEKLGRFLSCCTTLDRHQLFTIFILFWVGLAWLGLTLALLGVFHVAFFIVYFILGILFLIFLIHFNRTTIKIKPHFFGLFLLLTIVIIILSHYTTPTIFSGRDQGSLSEAAVQLAQNHQLTFSFDGQREFFKIYGPGKALNFPGFIYTPQGELTTQFPLGYITWLAIFYSIFDLDGFIIANSITFMLFIACFYLVARQYLRPSSSLIATLFILSSFSFSWFFKFTLSENLGLLLTWFALYAFIMFTHYRKRFYLLTSLSTIILLIFTRIEAISFLAIILLILLYKYRDWKYIVRVLIGKKSLLFIGGFFVLYFFNLAFDTQSYLFMLKNILHPFISLGSDLQEQTSKTSLSFFSTAFYTIKILSAYGIFSFIVLGIIGVIQLWKQRKIAFLLPFILLSPSFIYIIYPSISADHPWMLRRFLFSVLPISILYTVWFLDFCLPAGRGFLKKRFYFYFFTIFLIIVNLTISLPYLFISPNKNLLSQIETIAHHFESSDLILVDSEAAGSGWAMITGPLNFVYGKQAVYFFNSRDLEKLHPQSFSHIYFIIPDHKIEFYAKEGLLDKIIPIEDYSIQTNDLDVLIEKKSILYSIPIQLPQEKIISTNGKIYQLKQ